MDLKSLTDAEFYDLLEHMYVDAARRDIINNAKRKAEQLQEEYANAIGRTTGGEWTQPTGAHDAYPVGSLVTHEGELYISDIPNNVWAPGVHGWSISEDDEVVPEEQPDAHNWAIDTEYLVGDLVNYEGLVYRVIQQHTSQAGWLPSAVPALYVVV